MSKTWLDLLYFLIIITMCMKNGMSVGRLDDYHYKKKKWLKETISVKEGKEKLRQHNNYGWTLVE